MPHNHLLNYSNCAPAPIFNMQNCNVIIENPSSYQPCGQAPKKRRYRMIDSDSDRE